MEKKLQTNCGILLLSLLHIHVQHFLASNMYEYLLTFKEERSRGEKGGWLVMLAFPFDSVE